MLKPLNLCAIRAAPDDTIEICMGHHAIAGVHQWDAYKRDRTSGTAANRTFFTVRESSRIPEHIFGVRTSEDTIDWFDCRERPARHFISTTPAILSSVGLNEFLRGMLDRSRAERGFSPDDKPNAKAPNAGGIRADSHTHESGAGNNHPCL